MSSRVGKTFILTAFILIFFLIGAVSAAENVTDENLTVEVSQEEIEAPEDDINVTFDEQMWEENLSDIEVELPESASGHFAVKINDEVIYNETITNTSFKVPITLPKDDFILVVNVFPPIDLRTYKVSAFYNDIDLNITTPLKVMKYPPDFNMAHFPVEILQNYTYPPLLLFPRSANGTVEFYIDGKSYKNATARPTMYFEDNPFSKLSLGNHTFRVIYCGDGYYRPYDITFNFTVHRVVISIPEIVNISHDDCISVETLKNVKGNVDVYIDGRLIFSSNTKDGELILSLEDFIKYTDREVTVVYTNKDFSRTKTVAVNMTYYFDIWHQSSIYGMENTLDIIMPDTLNNSLLTITINGVEYEFTHPDYLMNNALELDISKFNAGNYSLFVSFAGDDKFYPLNQTYNFTIDYHIITPFTVDYKASSKVYLMLPEDARGNLTVQIDGKFYKSVNIKKGYGEIVINDLAPGDYVLTAEYEGSDYNVSEVKTPIRASPKISYTYEFTAGEDKYITVEVPNSSKGYVIFEVNFKQHTVQIRNGIAKLSLKSLEAGEYDISIDYYGDDGVLCSSDYAFVEIVKPKLKLVSAKATFKGVNVKIKLSTKKGKAMANRKVTVKFNGKKYTVKTNKKGILTLNKKMKLKNKKYTLTVTYNGAKLTKKIKAYPIYLKMSKTKKKLTVKAYVSKKAKNQIVKFKVKSKTYKVKTNAKGIAKITIKKPKKIPSIKATYLKNTVKI